MRASNARYGVILFAATLAIIQYIDRVCISESIGDIQKDLGFDKDTKGLIFSAFALSYALFEIPTGWLGDRFGVRSTLTRVVVWWSVFTMITGRVRAAWSMIVVRFLFGAGEAGCFPNITKAFSTWLPTYERVRAQSVLWLSARWGGAFTPLLVVWVLTLVGHWSYTFYIFGALGLVWAVFFHRWFLDNPHEHPSVNEEERRLLTGVENLESSHAAVPWKAYLRSPSAWLLWGQYFFLSYVWYFYVTWYPTFLKDVNQGRFGRYTLALLVGAPLLGGGFGSMISGFCQDALGRRLGSVAKARKALAIAGFLVASGLILLASRYAHKDTILTLAFIVGLAGLFNDFVMPSAWGTCMDVGGKFAGTFSGTMNMMGNFGGAVAPAAIGFILKRTNDNWTLTLLISSGAYFLGALCWFFIDPVTPLDKAEKPAAA